MKKIITKTRNRSSLSVVFNFIQTPTFLIGAIVFLAAILRLVKLGDIPFRVDGDASRFALEGSRMWKEKQPLFATGWQRQQNFIFYFYGLSLKIFGQNIFGTRIFSSLAGILAVILTFVLTKELFNEKVALFSSLFLATSPFHLVFSRNGMQLIHVTYFIPLIIFLLYRGFSNQKILYFLVAGVFLGLSQYFTHTARFIPVLSLISFLIFSLSSGKKLSLRKMFLFGSFFLSGFLLTYLPMIFYYLDHQNFFWERINLVSGANSLDQILWRAPRSFLVFYFPLSVRRFWFYYGNYLQPLPAVFFSWGLLISIFNFKKTDSQMLLAWFFSGLLLGSILTSNSPTPNRYLVIFPAVAIFIGLGITALSRFSFKLTSIAIAFLLIANLYTYWQHETRESFKYDKNTQIATYAGRYLAKKRGNFTVFFIGNRYMYYRAVPTLEFLAKKKGVDVFGPVEEARSKFKQNDVFIILPDRKKEIPALKSYYPDDRLLEFKNPFGKQLFFLFEKSSPLGGHKP